MVGVGIPLRVIRLSHAHFSFFPLCPALKE
jgi:hypothetical protein